MATVVALHGFTRGPEHLVSFSAVCQRRGWACLRPAVAPRWLPILINDRRHLSTVARRLVVSRRLGGPVVIVGHSAGAAAGSWMTPLLRQSGVDVAGLVYVDGNDSPNHLIERSWDALADVPIRAVMSPPGPCNRNGQLAHFLEARRPGSIAVVAGAGHGDIEMSGAAVYRRACGDRSGPQEWKAVQHTVLGDIARLIDSRSDATS